MEESVFTKIIKGEVPCHKLYEDELSIVILDVHPQLPGHTLIIPKQQIDPIWGLPDDLYHHLWDVAKKVQIKINETLRPVRVGIAVEGFGVPHVHIHLLPLNEIGDFKKPQDLDGEPNHDKLAEMAEKLRLN